VVLPVAVDKVLDWDDVCPSRQDMMAASGVVLENAADMAKAFPDLWPSHEAARQQKARSVTSCYYRDLSNSRTSHSSSVVAYRPAGPGQKDRTARFDLVLIRDPRAWLEAKLGPLAHFEMIGGAAPLPATLPIADARARLTALSARLDAALALRITNDRARLRALSHRMEAAQPNPAAA
jgi:putative DNA primase/helicase